MSPPRRLALIAAVICTALLMPLTAGGATSTWTVMPDQQNATADGLTAVSCPSVSFCLALGSNGQNLSRSSGMAPPGRCRPTSARQTKAT